MLRLWYNSDCFIQITYFWERGVTTSPSTHLLDSVVFKEVCENLFDDLNKLTEARNDPIQTTSYEGKLIELRERIDRVMRGL